MLNAMTDEQKAAVRQQLQAAFTVDDAMTRFHERREVIERATPPRRSRRRPAGLALHCAATQGLETPPGAFYGPVEAPSASQGNPRA
jgi:hypothetical protein